MASHPFRKPADPPANGTHIVAVAAVAIRPAPLPGPSGPCVLWQLISDSCDFSVIYGAGVAAAGE